MKFNLITSLLLSCACFGQDQGDSLQKNLGKIRWLESTIESREFVSNFSNVLGDIDVLNSGRIFVILQAHKTGNVDLINLVKKDIRTVDWTRERTWKEGLKLANRHGESIALLGKWNSSIKTEFKGYFLNAPDVPYEKINAWYSGYLYRGLQGVILKSIAQNDINTFKEVIALLNDKSVSLSKKRTIVWAMRHDHSGFSRSVLESKIRSELDIPQADIKESLAFLLKEK